MLFIHQVSSDTAAGEILGLIYLTVCDWVKPCGSMPVNPDVVLADWKCSLHFLASWHCPAGYSETKKCNLAYITVPSADSHGVGSAGCIDLLESSRVCICKDPRKRIPVPDSQYLCMPGASVGPALVGSLVLASWPAEQASPWSASQRC